MRITGGIVQVSHDKLGDGKVQLNAVPLDGYTFKHFIIDGEIIVQNPHVTDGKWEAVFCVTMRDYLMNVAAVNLKDTHLIPISINRGFSLDDDVLDVSIKMRELATADLYLLVANSPSNYGGKEESDFYWKHKESSYSMSAFDKKMFLKQANDIYLKHGEPKRGATMTVINL